MHRKWWRPETQCGEQDELGAVTTHENMFALTSTWPKELDDKLIQSTKYCHFMLAFDSNNNKLRNYTWT